MTKRETLYDGVSSAAWAYLFLYFNINLGRFNILPAFVGWGLFLSAIGQLKEERRDLALLRPLGQLLLVWHLADWVVSWSGTGLNGRFPVAEMLIGAAAMYFHFQFLTDCAALAAAYQSEGEGLDRRLLRWRTVQTVLLTVMTLQAYPAWRQGDAWEYVLMALTAVYLFAGLCVMFALFDLKGLFREEPA